MAPKCRNQNKTQAGGWGWRQPGRVRASSTCFLSAQGQQGEENKTGARGGCGAHGIFASAHGSQDGDAPLQCPVPLGKQRSWLSGITVALWGVPYQQHTVQLALPHSGCCALIQPHNQGNPNGPIIAPTTPVLLGSHTPRCLLVTFPSPNPQPHGYHGAFPIATPLSALHTSRGTHALWLPFFDV